MEVSCRSWEPLIGGGDDNAMPQCTGYVCKRLSVCNRPLWITQLTQFGGERHGDPNYFCLCVCVNSCHLSGGYSVKLHPHEKIHTYDSPKLSQSRPWGFLTMVHMFGYCSRPQKCVNSWHYIEYAHSKHKLKFCKTQHFISWVQWKWTWVKHQQWKGSFV